MTDMDPQNAEGVDLSPAERRMLVRGLNEWGGPARCTQQMAAGMGFRDLEHLLDECRRLSGALASDTPLDRDEWRKVLLAVEIAFASDVVGSGLDWSSTVGMTDEETIRVLRSCQRKMGRLIHDRGSEGADGGA